jgi:serine/threonine-protein kinase
MALPFDGNEKADEDRSRTCLAFPPSALAAPQSRYRVGSVLSEKYRLESLIGEGGMGAVWRASNLLLGLPVAIKLIRADLDRDALRARLHLEARSVAKLGHPAIVRVYDVGESELGDPFIVMELLHGETLAQLLGKGRLSAVRAVQLLLPIIDALLVAHARGIVHRDLKPGNILLDRGVARIADFGLASLRADVTRDGTKSLTDVALAATAAPAAALTRAGDVFGTPAYMAPELAGGVGDAPPASDVFAFGVLAYEMVSGRAPFEVAPVLERMAGHAIAPPAPPAGDDALASVILSCLDLDPTRRPTAPELARALGATA